MTLHPLSQRLRHSALTMRWVVVVFAFSVATLCARDPISDLTATAKSITARCPDSDSDLRYWLENMVVFHHFTPKEVAVATGLTSNEVFTAVAKFDFQECHPPQRKRGEPLRVLPYPGARQSASSLHSLRPAVSRLGARSDDTHSRLVVVLRRQACSEGIQAPGRAGWA